MGPLEGPLAEKVCPFTQRRKGLIYLQVCSACNIVFAKMSGSHELKKVVIWEIQLLIELASRKTWEPKRVLWWELGLLRGSVSCKGKTCPQAFWVLLLLGELLDLFRPQFSQLCFAHLNEHAMAWGSCYNAESSSVGLGWARDSAFLTGFWVMPMLLALVSQLE